MINIIGGNKKKALINVPTNNVRPTSSKKREAIFSIIESYGKKINYDFYNRASIIDLFAGSGALGLEAISRGAVFGFFFEFNSKVILDLKKNCIKICQQKNYKIIQEDVLLSKFKNINRKISLIFIDPPYKIIPFEKILVNIEKSQILSKKNMIIIECSANSLIKIPSKYECFKEKNYGKTNILFLTNKNN